MQSFFFTWGSLNFREVSHAFRQVGLKFQQIGKLLSKLTKNVQNGVGLALIHRYTSMVILPIRKLNNYQNEDENVELSIGLIDFFDGVKDSFGYIDYTNIFLFQ